MKTIQELQQDWNENPRWNGIIRPYTPEDVLRLRGSYKIDYTIAQLMAEKFWSKLNSQSMWRD